MFDLNANLEILKQKKK